MDINDLLAREQKSLLQALFGAGGGRAAHLVTANGYADRLRASTYPHRHVHTAMPS